jgi:tetratricopeptide (TPR) repeat protein
MTVLTAVCAAVCAAACASAPVGEGTPLPSAVPPSAIAAAQQPAKGSAAAQVKALVEEGTPLSLARALTTLRTRNVLSSEYGRACAFAAVTLMRKLYPAVQAEFPALDPPVTHPYTKIIKNAEKGEYTAPLAGSIDYLEYVLPFLGLLNEVRQDRLLAAVRDLEAAERLNGLSVLAPCFLGMACERLSRPDEAAVWYRKASARSQECYPASLGLARILDSRGETQEAQKLLAGLVVRFPDNLQIKRQLALSYYRARDWTRALSAVSELLQRDSKNKEFILIRAHALVEQGQFLQAQGPLDLYTAIDPNNRLYLYLRARVQAEGYRNRDAAMNYVRALLGVSSEDDEATVYAARLLLESERAEDQEEGRALLRKLLAGPRPSLDIVSLAVDDAIRRREWREARPQLIRLLRERRSEADLYAAYRVERGQGSNEAALAYAEELYARDNTSENGAGAYITALIAVGRREEAGRVIEARLAGLPGGVLKGRYYYLRSRTRTNEEAEMNDLRASLFEDPRGLSAIKAMFTIYHKRKDESRAVFYLKQALSLSPDDPELQAYQKDYAAALGAAP